MEPNIKYYANENKDSLAKGYASLIKKLVDKSINVESSLTGMGWVDMLIALRQGHDRFYNLEWEHGNMSPIPIYQEKLQAQIDYFVSSGEVLGETLSNWLGLSDCDLTLEEAPSGLPEFSG